jgi:hypothetical protein
MVSQQGKVFTFFFFFPILFYSNKKTLFSLVLLRACAAINVSFVPVHITNIRTLIDNILKTSNVVRHSIVKESDLLEMLQEVRTLFGNSF